MIRNNDSTLPSCKVVVVKGKGMRIKGIVGDQVATTKCKVRNIADEDGYVTSYNRFSKPKVTMKETTNKHNALLTHKGVTKLFVYDTGAMVTSMNRQDAIDIGIVDAAGNSEYDSRAATVRGVGGRRTGKYYKRVPLTLNRTNETAVGDVFVADDINMQGSQSNLLGVPHIKNYKRYRLKFRF